jgi:undecaprenyl-diphosphatase
MPTTANEIVKKKAGRLSLKTILVTAILLLACFAFAAIADEMVIENESGFDFWVFTQLKKITSDGLTGFMKAITFLGSSYFLLPAYCVVIAVFLLQKNWRSSLNIAAIGIAGNIVLYSFKYIFHRQRPVDPFISKLGDFSFPSGHSFASFTFFGLMMYITFTSRLKRSLQWLISILLFLVAFLVALSRVYLHFHYASDVIAGFMLAAVWLLLSLWVLNMVDRKLVEKKG